MILLDNSKRTSHIKEMHKTIILMKITTKRNRKTLQKAFVISPNYVYMHEYILGILYSNLRLYKISDSSKNIFIAKYNTRVKTLFQINMGFCRQTVVQKWMIPVCRI